MKQHVVAHGQLLVIIQRALMSDDIQEFLILNEQAIVEDDRCGPKSMNAGNDQRFVVQMFIAHLLANVEVHEWAGKHRAQLSDEIGAVLQ